MNATIAAQMTGADFLKLRKKRGTLIWALVVGVAPLVIFFVVRAAQHGSNPLKYEPAGGYSGLHDGIRILAAFFGPLAAILIGTEAGAGDSAAGVFRDLVVTGRSRLALFATRVPAALAVTWLIMLLGYALLVIGTYAFAGSAPTPAGATVVNGLLFTLLSTGVTCTVAVGLAALTNSRPAALTAFIGWQLVASPILASISSLGAARKIVLSQSILHFSPVAIDGRGGNVAVSQGLAIVVLAGWLIVFLGLGAWRTRTMDA